MCPDQRDLTGRYAVPTKSVYDWVSPTTVYEPKESVPRGTKELDREQYAYSGVAPAFHNLQFRVEDGIVEGGGGLAHTAARLLFRPKGGETFSIPVTLTQPKVTKEDLGGALFRDLLGESIPPSYTVASMPSGT